MTRHPLSILAAALLLAFGAAQAQSPAAVAVAFESPEKFTDLRNDRMASERERNALLAELRTWLGREAPRRLPAGSRLEITITDIDMAGDFEPWRGAAAANVRIVRDIYPARVNLSFRLVDAAGKTLKEGTRKLASTGFIAEPRASRPLSYEKELLEEWLAREFA